MHVLTINDPGQGCVMNDRLTGKTGEAEGHAHDVDLWPDGSGYTGVSRGHNHPVENHRVQPVGNHTHALTRNADIDDDMDDGDEGDEPEEDDFDEPEEDDAMTLTEETPMSHPQTWDFQPKAGLVGNQRKQRSAIRQTTVPTVNAEGETPLGSPTWNFDPNEDDRRGEPELVANDEEPPMGQPTWQF